MRGSSCTTSAVPLPVSPASASAIRHGAGPGAEQCRAARSRTRAGDPASPAGAPSGVAAGCARDPARASAPRPGGKDGARRTGSRHRFAIRGGAPAGAGLSTAGAAGGRSAFFRRIQGSTAHDRLRSGLRLWRDHRLVPFGAEGASSATAFFRGLPGLRRRAWHHQPAQSPSAGRWRKEQSSRSADPGLRAWRRDAAQARRRPARPPNGRPCSGQAPGTGWRASRSTRHSGSSRWAWFRSVRTCWDRKAGRLLPQSAIIVPTSAYTSVVSTGTRETGPHGGH